MRIEVGSTLVNPLVPFRIHLLQTEFSALNLEDDYEILVSFETIV